MNNNFYVYVYMDPRKPGDYKFGELNFSFEPFYIGKGIGSRKTEHLREAKSSRPLQPFHNPLKINKIRKILKEGYEPLIELVYQGLSNEEAEVAEERCIALIGRLVEKKGPLTNKASGNPFKGTMVLSGEAHWGYGLARSEETRKKISENHKDCSGSNNSRAKKWRLISPTNEIIECYGNLKKVCDELNINESILRGIRGHRYELAQYNRIYELKKAARFQRIDVKAKAFNTIGWKVEEIQ